MKREKLSIKWSLLGYLILFNALLLVILWFLQTVYLDRFYKKIRKDDLGTVRNKILKNIDDNNISARINKLADEYDICIMIVNDSGETLYSSRDTRGCNIHTLSVTDIRKLYEKTEKYNNCYEMNVMDKNIDMDVTVDYSGSADASSETSMESVLFSNIVKSGNNGKVMVLMESAITPVKATVHTLRVQLVYVSVIMVILSFCLSFIISRRVTKSLVNISVTANELAEGNYDVSFEGRDYKEIAGLSDTLNHVAVKLARIDVLQRELIANVSHDLRTPLTMIAGYAEVMRDIPGENTPENIQVIIDETTRLTTLVNELLDASRISAGVNELESDEYDITVSISSVVGRICKMVEPYGYMDSFEYDRQIYVEADEYKIYQVVYNLIGNAINYTGNDGCVFVRQIVNGDVVRIEVEDTGEGIPESEQENVWRRYYRAGGKRNIVGTGMGLSIAKEVLKMHNMKYGVRSTVGMGSTFWFETKILRQENL